MFRRMKESAMMKHLMENIRDNIYFMDREGHITLVSKAGAKWLGFESAKRAAVDFFRVQIE